VIASDSDSDSNSQFVRELLSLIFQEMAGVKVGVSVLSENAIKLCVRIQGSNNQV
jgi:hypothetical protein